jgi:hypothetical protein
MTRYAKFYGSHAQYQRSPGDRGSSLGRGLRPLVYRPCNHVFDWLLIQSVASVRRWNSSTCSIVPSGHSTSTAQRSPSPTTAKKIAFEGAMALNLRIEADCLGSPSSRPARLRHPEGFGRLKIRGAPRHPYIVQAPIVEALQLVARAGKMPPLCKSPIYLVPTGIAVGVNCQTQADRVHRTLHPGKSPRSQSNF